MELASGLAQRRARRNRDQCGPICPRLRSEDGRGAVALAKKSEVTIPTPVCGKELAYITSGNRPIQPIFAIKPGAAGDISLKKEEEKNSHIVWSKMRGGPYMPTPILYGDYFYTCSNSGIVTCYEAKTGKEIYKKRMGDGSYTASPVAADGRLYFCSEKGEVRVVKAGPSSNCWPSMRWTTT